MQKDASNKPDNATVVTLESEHWKLKLEPQTALQTLHCQIKHNGAWTDLMPNCASADVQKGTPINASNFHMLPYSNRIRDARFTHDGQDVQLDGAEKHAIHGALRKLAWRVTEQSKTSVTAEYDTAIDGDVNWPWPIKASVSYTLEDQQLISRMSLTNMGSNTMPAGMGWHPYFVRTIAGAEPTLTIPVNGMYPDTDGDCLPTGAAIPLSAVMDFNKARKLDPAQRIDHCLSGFKSPAILEWPDAGIRLEMHASDNCTHLVLYNPDEPYFAVEPVTNANDAFNLAGKGVAAGDAGVHILQAGETLEAGIRLELAQHSGGRIL